MLHRKHSFQISKQDFCRHFLQIHFRSKSNRGFRNIDGEENCNIIKKSENHEANIYLLKSRGQHLLTNPRVLDSIISKSNILPTDTVLEIGPGTGNLTLKLLNVAEKVIAIEVDKRMIEILNKRATEHCLRDKLTCMVDHPRPLELVGVEFAGWGSDVFTERGDRIFLKNGSDL
ncbi:unnamed protein product [Cuscuta epithymum]|uniref:rRNA adenine N(6)-methyltransferase n=1 Tax=Cuscuta epithymum TaxID=186058 RepID=A0AAV0FVT6_9ASTE|nr:unnamed protein product [Cuscuta epithymum]